MKAFSIVAAAALIATGSAASAQSTNDMQCLILSNIFAKQSKEPQQQKAAEAAVYFYMGRVRAGATAAQLKPVLEEAGKSITDATAGPKMNDCIKSLQSTGQLLQSLSPPAAAAPATQPAKPQNQPQGR